MNHARILDCTLRDGAYLIDKKFGENAILGIINGLVKSNIEIIEIGFLQDEGFGEGKTVYQNAESARKYIPAEGCKSEFAVLADYSRYSIDNLEECSGDSFTIVRECFFKHERFDALGVCKKIKEKGYKLFVQPVDIMGYTDIEMVQFIQMVNEIEPYCLSIVDTFGSMYIEDLQRIYNIIDHNLIHDCCIGFHSHNNMQMSNALSQEFLKMTYARRKVVVDTTICGMGRGAGNTPTELVAQFMASQMGYSYNIDELLDVIDSYMGNIRSRCSWGYTTPYFIAGCYNAHVNNVTYLTEKNSIRSRDMRYILNKVDGATRKKYDYDLLEKTYMEYVSADIDDSLTMNSLKEIFGMKNVILILPGNSIKQYSAEVREYINEKKWSVIAVNFIPSDIPIDYVFVSNVKRFRYWSNSTGFKQAKKILTSNIAEALAQYKKEYIVSFAKLVKCGWEHMDNAMIMLLRLLDNLGVKQIAAAGFDGYAYKHRGELNFVSEEVEVELTYDDPILLNQEIREMLEDYKANRRNTETLEFLTPSRFEEIFSGDMRKKNADAEWSK